MREQEQIKTKDIYRNMTEPVTWAGASLRQLTPMEQSKPLPGVLSNIQQHRVIKGVSGIIAMTTP